MTKHSTTQIHDLTLDRVQMMQAEYQGRRDAATRELAAIFTARQKGLIAAPVPMTETEKRAAERARSWLNGSGEALLGSVPVERENDLTIEVAAIDLVLRALQREELPARAARATLWIQDNADRWKAKARAAILLAHQLAAVEDSMRAMLESAPDVIGMPGLALAQYFGGAYSIMAQEGGQDPLREIRRVAIQDGVITSAELKKVTQDVCK